MRPAEIENLSKSSLENDREQAIVLLNEHLRKHPSDVESWFNLACCFDFLGKEQEAEPSYERAYQLGVTSLPLNEQMLFFVGYGSTLRNNKKFGDSQRILREGITKFPEHVALKIFLGFTLYAAGEHKEASKTLLTMAGQLPSDIVDGYGRAIGWNSKQLE